MYKSDEEVEALLNHKNNGLVKIKIMGPGNHGNQKVEGDHKQAGEQKRSAEEKAKVVEIAAILGNQRLAGLVTNTHPSAVSKYSNGKNANNQPDPELQTEIETRLGKISDKAAEKVDMLLEIFAEDKMDQLKAGEIPQAAEKLVGIIEKVRKTTNKEGNVTNRPVVIIHAPVQQNIDQYITKEVN